MATSKSEQKNESILASALGAASDEKIEKSEPSTWKPPSLVVKPNPLGAFTPFWLDETEGRAGLVGTTQPIKLTEKQWRRRTPRDWGVLIAQEKITVRNIPEQDADAVADAEDAERARISNERIFSEAERALIQQTQGH